MPGIRIGAFGRWWPLVFCLLLTAAVGFGQSENPPTRVQKKPAQKKQTPEKQAQEKQKERGKKRSRDRLLRSRIQTLFYDFKAAGKEMEYGLFVPSSYDGKAPAPLIVALHGLAGNPRQILNYPGMLSLAEKHGYVIAAPMGYNRRGWYGIFGPRPRGAKPKNLGELSEQDVMNVVGIIEKKFRIDPDRVYLMGHSMGGGGTLHLGIKHPHKWAALGPIAPAIYTGPSKLKAIQHVPVIVVQGDRDFLVPVRGTRLWVKKMKELKMTYSYLEVKGGGHIYPAFQKLPDIFAFFNKHRRKAGAEKKDAAKKAAVETEN